MNKPRKTLNIRERMFKRIFVAGDRYRSFASSISGICRFIVTVTLSLFLLGVIFYLGFGSTPENLGGLRSAFRIMFFVIFFAKYIPGLLRFKKEKRTRDCLHLSSGGISRLICHMILFPRWVKRMFLLWQAK